jgi:type II secretory pathway pseudopilin PulG
MIVLAIIALLAAIATSNILRARKRAQAVKELDDLRTLDGALDQYALENNKSTGDMAEFSDLQIYLKKMNKMAMDGYDLFGQAYGPYSVDTGPKVPDYTFNVLSDVAPAEFWSPFK